MAASCVTFRGYEPATTGRIAVAAPVFTQLRGYDEDCHGSGYEDVDFSQRCAAAADGGYVAAPHKLHGVKNVTLTDSHAIVGYPIANVDLPLDDLRVAEVAARREERSGAKVVHCKNPLELSWGQFNSQNAATLKDRLSRGQLVRNEGGCDLGWRFVVVQPPPPPAQTVGQPAKRRRRHPEHLLRGFGGGAPLTVTEAEPAAAALAAAAAGAASSSAAAVMQGLGIGGGAPAEAEAAAVGSPPSRPVPIVVQDRSLCRVRVVSFGIDLLERGFWQTGARPSQFAENVSDSMRRGEGGLLDQNDLREAIADYCIATKRPVGDVHVFDSRCFMDPHRPDVNHVGTDLAVLRGVVSHPRFPAWWRAKATHIADVLFTHLAPPPWTPLLAAGPTFAFFCRKGRRRSVAMATLLTELLRAHGWEVEVCHFHQDYWQFGTCNQCATCRELRTADKCVLYREVADMLQAHQLPPYVL